jgi:hypothetical protein
VFKWMEALSLRGDVMTLKTYIVPTWLKMYVPPVGQGQIVEYSYGIDGESQLAVMRVFDRSDGDELWYVASLTGKEIEALESWCGDNVPSVAGEWRLVRVVRS